MHINKNARLIRQRQMMISLINEPLARWPLK